MLTNKKIVIAGKNQCAVNIHKYFKNNYPKHELIGVANSDDNVNDGWQPSYKKYLLKMILIIKTQAIGISLPTFSR